MCSVKDDQVLVAAALTLDVLGIMLRGKTATFL
jgi:hypothetical protein